MTDIDRLISRAALRLWIGSFARALFLTATLAIAALACLRIAGRLLGFTLDWTTAAIIAGAAALIFSAAWSIVTRNSRLAVARSVDEHADLREALSTALCVRDKADPWSRAAVAHASSLTRRVIIRQAFPASVPRHWYAPLILVALFFASGLLPQQNWLSMLSEASAAEEREIEAAETRAQVESTTQDLASSLANIADEQLARELDTDFDLPETATPQEIRRDAIKKLTSVKDRLQQLQQSERSRSHKELSERMKQLRQPGNGPLNELAKALQRSDFKAASAELDELMKKLANAELSDAEKQALAEQLKNLAQQLEQLAEQQQALENALERAGLDPELATGSPDALRQAIQTNPNLTPAQKEALEKLAEQAAQCAGACQSMASAAAAAASGNPNGQLGNLSEFGDQLSQLEMAQAELANIQQGLSECNSKLASLGDQMGQCEGGGLCTAPGSGPGTGNRGQGGGIPGEEKNDNFQTVRKKSNTFQGEGPIIGSMFVEGGKVKGESVQQFSDAVQAGSSAAAEAIDTQRIPREYHDAVKHYFGRLEQQADDSKEAKEPAQ